MLGLGGVAVMLTAVPIAVGVLAWRLERQKRGLPPEEVSEAQLEADRLSGRPAGRYRSIIEFDGVWLFLLFIGMGALQMTGSVPGPSSEEYEVLALAAGLGIGGGWGASHLMRNWHLRAFCHAETRLTPAGRLAVRQVFAGCIHALLAIVLILMFLAGTGLSELDTIEECLNRGIYEKSAPPKTLGDLSCDLDYEDMRGGE